MLCELPKPLQSASDDTPHSEYPSAAFANASTLLVSDGRGTLYALRVEESGPATTLNAFELKIPAQYETSQPSVPFRIHAAAPPSSGSCLVLLSSKHYSAQTDSEEKKRAGKNKYDVWAVNVDLEQIPQDQPLGLDIAWHRRGDDVPLEVTYVESQDAFMLIGSSAYRPLNAPAPLEYNPSSDEIAPIPRAGENLDGAAPTPDGPPQPPPYSWTQTDDSVTVVFPIPSTTPKEAIKVTLTPTTLSLFIDDSVSTDTLPLPLPRYALAKWWDTIRPTTSFWTLDRAGGGAVGLLTLHLDKAHDGTRWAHVFAAAGLPGGDPDVPETLDPSELAAIRDALEKYTAALQGGDAGLGRGVPSLAEGEVDEDVDASVGDGAVLTWVGRDGGAPACARAPGEDAPFTLLATPLPGHVPSRGTLVVRHGMDGLQVRRRADADVAGGWAHEATFCVLAFVLASKRDTRFVHHLASRAVLAFESGARGLGANVYIYRPTARRGDKWAKQAILKIGDGSHGALLGVGAAVTKEGKEEILCLCENELVVIQSTL